MTSKTQLPCKHQYFLPHVLALGCPPLEQSCIYCRPCSSFHHVHQRTSEFISRQHFRFKLTAFLKKHSIFIFFGEDDNPESGGHYCHFTYCMALEHETHERNCCDICKGQYLFKETLPKQLFLKSVKMGSEDYTVQCRPIYPASNYDQGPFSQPRLGARLTPSNLRDPYLYI